MYSGGDVKTLACILAQNVFRAHARKIFELLGGKTNKLADEILC